jgi:CheY-like chemotaxis protein
MSADSTAPGGRQLLPGIPAEHHGNGERILHIDDEPAVTTTIRRLLQKLGYRVESFNAPHAGTRRFCEAPHEFDLVLTDLMMPGMNGIEVAAAIRSVRPDLPIVLHSAYAERQDDSDYRSNGIREIMAKPADLARIAATIRRALSPASSSP